MKGSNGNMDKAKGTINNRAIEYSLCAPFFISFLFFYYFFFFFFCPNFFFLLLLFDIFASARSRRGQTTKNLSSIG